MCPTDFLLDSRLGFVQASQGRSLCSFGGSSTPEMRYALSRYHPGSQTSTQTIFCCRLPEVVFQNLLVVFRFHESFDPDKIPSSKRTETSPQHYTPTSMFYSGDDVLWVEHLSLLSPKIGNISMAKELYLVSSDQRTRFQYAYFSPGCPLNFSLAWRCLFFRRGVFIEISIPDLTKSFTSVLAVVISGGQSTQIKYLSKSTDTYNKILL